MALWLSPQPLVLASKSDVRGKMLAAVGLRFEIRPAQIDERAVEAKAGTTDAAAARLAGAQHQPANRAAAAEQLRALRGRTHELHSALALVRDGAVLFDCVDSARLTMRKISDRFIDDYLDMAGTAALASVGGYQL